MIRLSKRYKAKVIEAKNANNAKGLKVLPDSWIEFAKLCDIRSGSEIVKFDPYEYQKILISQIEKSPTTVITKTRQLGITETVSNYFLFKACKNRGYLAVVFSKTQADTSNIAKRIRRQIDSLYEYVETESDSLTNLEIKNGGRILFRNSTANGARGLESVSDILFDEAAFIDEIEEIYKSAIPTTTAVGDRARIIILSTPCGQSGWYWDKLSLNNGDRDVLSICQEIKKEKIAPLQYWTDKNGWCKFVLHWLAHPEFSLQKDTYLQSIKQRFELPDDVIAQEYDLSFTDSDTLVFSSELVRKCAVGQWRDREDFAIYYFGVDTSLLGDDYTVCTILQQIQESYHLVAMYRDRKKTHQHNIYEIGKLIDLYKPIKVAIETNSSGQIYYDELSQQHLNTEFIPIKTTGSSKPAMIQKLTLTLEKGNLILPSDRHVIEEFLSFKRNGNKLEAIAGKHDDIVMSLAFAVAGIS